MSADLFTADAFEDITEVLNGAAQLAVDRGLRGQQAVGYVYQIITGACVALIANNIPEVPDGGPGIRHLKLVS